MTFRYPLTLYVDRDCPLCAREIRWLQRHASPARLHLVDVSAPDFDPRPTGRSLAQLRACLHARSADGQWLTGVDATLGSWRAAGFTRFAAVIGWHPLRPLLRLGYRLFARLRPRLHWLPHPDGAARCAGNTCATPPRRRDD